MQSITLQTGDTIVTSGDKLGQLQFAASAESDGGAAIVIAGSVYSQAEGSFTSSSNPTSLVLATAAADASAAVGRIKVTDQGHILPMSNQAYDLGNNNLKFRNLYVQNVESETLTGDLDATIVVECKNSTGSTINAGTPVYVSGYYSSNGKALIAPAVGNDSTKMPAIGLLQSTLTDGSEGYVDTFGQSTGFDTSAYTVGDTVYVDPTGGLTDTRPTGVNELVQNMGRVLRSDASQGRILVLGPGRTNDTPNSGDYEQLTVANYSFPTSDGSADQVIKTDGAGNLSFTTVSTGGLSNIVEDTTPQLGGTLDANGNTIDMGTNTITDTKVGQWDTAYGWGDHSTQGYLTTDSDTTYTAGSGLTLVGTEFNIYGGSGHFDEIIFDSGLYKGVNISFPQPYNTPARGNIVIGGANDLDQTLVYAGEIRIGTNIAEDSVGSVRQNICMGNRVFQNASGQQYNVAIGDFAFSSAQISSQSSTQNVGIGHTAGNSTIAKECTFVGSFAGRLITHKSNRSVAIGADSLYYGVYADYSNMIGYRAGVFSSGSYNIGIGAGALTYATGVNNIEIITDNTALTNNIGANSNKLHIENTIIGDTSSKLLAIGNVGSADLTPDATLEIKPNATTDVGLIVQAVASHSASLQEWQNSSETKLLAVGPDGGLEIPSNTPSSTTNKLYNDGSNLNFGSKIIIDSTNVNTGLQYQPLGGGLNVTGLTTTEFSAATLVTEADSISSNDNDTTIPTSAAVKDYVDNNAGSSYTAGSGLTLVGTEFNIYGGSGYLTELQFPLGSGGQGIYNATGQYLGIDIAGISGQPLNLDYGNIDISIGHGNTYGHASLPNSSKGGNVLVGNYLAGSGNSYNTEFWGNVLLGNAIAHSRTGDLTRTFGFGKYALIFSSGVDRCIAMGEDALRGAYDAFDVIAIGGAAGMGCDNASTCVMIGSAAGGDGYANSSIYIGHNTGGVYENETICIGSQVGVNSSGNYNIMMGGYAVAYNLKGNNNIEIRTRNSSVETIIGTNDNKINIEKTIIGDTSSKLLAIGNVGSADLTPDATLEVKPNATTDVGLIVQAVASHSASLQEWQNSSETKLLAVGPDGGLEIPSNVPSTTTNKFYNNGGTLYFNGSAVNTDTDTTYTAGSGLTLVGTEFNVHGGSGQFREILIDDNFPITIKSEGNSFSSYGPDIRLGYAVAEGITSSTPSEDGNVIIGDFAASGATGNNRGVIIGQRAARNSVIGATSILIGAEAGYFTKSAQTQFIGVGYSALGSTSGCSVLTAIGSNAGANSTSSSWSNFIGHSAGQASQSVTYSNIFGYSAGRNHKAGSYNNYFGDRAALAASGSYNIGIGRNSFLQAAGSNNIEIVTNGNSSSIIGTNDNKIHIENTIIGDTSSKLLAIGNVTSSDLTPDATLEIKPNATTDVGLIVQAVASHSASLQEWQNSSETKLVAIGPDGGVELPSNVPSTTTNKFYNNGGTLYFNGSAVNTDTDTTYTAGTGLTLNSTTFDINLADATTQTTAANTVTTTASRTYAVQINGSDQLVVNVPWTDTDTDTQLSQEQVEDYAGNLISTGGTKTGITVTYQDTTNDVDFVVGGLTTTEFAAATLVTSAEGISSNNNDTTIPTSAAVKAYADSVGGGGGGSPGGSDTQIQFNDGGSFGGDADLVWNKTTNALTITGSLNATTKSFLIDHPSKPGMKLQYASLEGPENGVYVRGTTDKSFITLPDYWRDLVHNDSITVTVTPVGQFQPLFVEDKNNREIRVGGVCGHYDYVVWGERKDVDKLEVEW